MTKAVPALLFALVAASCQREAAAQQAVERDPLGPVRCFTITTDRQLSEQSAIQLCAGMPNDAPGRCYSLGLDEAPGLSSQQLQQLCSAASDVDPLRCYQRLDAEGSLTDQQIIDYCRTTCPVGPPPPQASSPACLASALRDTQLALQTAGELCVNSSSAGPVACYLAGEDLQTLTDSQLVQLCAEQFQCQYYNAAPTGGYAPSARY